MDITQELNSGGEAKDPRAAFAETGGTAPPPPEDTGDEQQEPEFVLETDETPATETPTTTETPTETPNTDAGAGAAFGGGATQTPNTQVDIAAAVREAVAPLLDKKKVDEKLVAKQTKIHQKMQKMTQDYKEATAEYDKAVENEDIAKQIRWQTKMSSLEEKAEAVREEAAALNEEMAEAEKNPSPTSTGNAGSYEEIWTRPDVQSQFQNWVRDNPWFDPSNQKGDPESAVAHAEARRLITQEGILPNTPAFYTRINTHLRTTFPHKAAPATSTAGTTTHNAPAITNQNPGASATPTGGGKANPGKNSVIITKQDQADARSMWPNDEKLRNEYYKQLAREKRIDRNARQEFLDGLTQ